MGVRRAALVAPLALRGARCWDPELLVRWRGAYHRKVTRRQIICRITADLLRRPAATRVTVRALSIAPWLARPLFRIMYRDSTRTAMTLAIRGLGTAPPANRLPQMELAEAAKQFFGRGRRAAADARQPVPAHRD